MTTDMIAAPAPKAALDLALLKAVGLDRAAPEQRQLAIARCTPRALPLLSRLLSLALCRAGACAHAAAQADQRAGVLMQSGG